MKRLLILCFAAFIGLTVVPTGQADPPGGKDVNIVNSIPLPIKGEISATVQGDVNVVNQPTVEARQSGLWKIEVIPYEPYIAELFTTLEEGTGASPSGPLLPAVPDGKQAVIEHVSVLAVLPDGQTVTGLELFSGVGSHFLSMIPQGTNSENRGVFVTSQPLRAYLRSGTSVAFTLRRGPTAVGNAFFEMVATGYLIDDAQ